MAMSRRVSCITACVVLCSSCLHTTHSFALVTPVLTKGIILRGPCVPGYSHFWSSARRRVCYAGATGAGQEEKRFVVPPAQPGEGLFLAQYLVRAGVPSDAAKEAEVGLKGAVGMDLDFEVGGRLRQLNFLMQQGIYTYATACELIALQPGFLRLSFSLAYEDEGLLVLNKPFDTRMDVPRGEGRKWEGEVTCADWVGRVTQNSLDRMRFAHNLDSATSGVLVVAKDRAHAAECVALFQTRQVQKEYLAVVRGHVEWEERIVDAPIGPGPIGEFCMQVGGEGAKSAVTRMQVLERGYLGIRGPSYGSPVTTVSLKPVTGRRHQLRVHLKHCGHPIVGDAAYAQDWYTHRLFLHAHRLYLPLKRKPELCIETPDPFADSSVLDNPPQ